MIDLLDILLHDVLKAGVRSLAPSATSSVADEQVSSTPPDETWRHAHADPSGAALSVYLVELRENTKLRSNERLERQTAAGVVSRRAPYRLDCHYLISAYHAGLESAHPPPTQQEHKLLYEATAALAHARPLVPSRFYPTGTSKLIAWPAAFHDHELLMDINPTSGFPKLAEFWGSLSGKEHPWRPVVHLVVTLPVELLDTPPIQIVRTRVTSTQQGQARDTVTQIGGVVIDRGGAPVPRAWVILEDGHQHEVARTTADDDGRYVLTLEAPGQVLYAAAFGLGRSVSINILQVNDHTLRFS